MHQHTYLAELFGGPGDGGVLKLTGTRVHPRLVFPCQGSLVTFVAHSTGVTQRKHVYILVKEDGDVAHYRYRGIE